jgi:hypothetical protein
MTHLVQSPNEPDAAPVGHTRTRADLRERPAWSLSGWLGVLVLAACIAASVLLVHRSIEGVIAVPIAVGVVVLTSLVIVQPGKTRA